MEDSGTSTFFMPGDRARYTGMAMLDGECLCSGDVVTVVTANHDPEDDCIVEFRGAYLAVSAPFLTWLERPGMPPTPTSSAGPTGGGTSTGTS